MGSLEDKPKRTRRRKIKVEPVVEKPKKQFKALSEIFKDRNFKVKKLGIDYRFSDNTTLIEDVTPDREDLEKIADYIQNKAGKGISVTVTSILKGAR
jgi:cell fate regulator YaaT (PSP1 superfamily)